ncbi:MAG: hypothetical protein LUE31_07990 [Lachnospiraceae bacterium]|nr:hypothetical protein [Lachnospiraceae bacterium]
MSGFSARWEDPFVPPLFLLNGKNDAFETYARRHKRNLIRGFTVDEAGIVWADDGATLVEFPLHWPDEAYRAPDNVTGVFRWAFNECDVKRVVASRELAIVGAPASPVRGDLSKIDPQSERYDPNFLVIEERTASAAASQTAENNEPKQTANSHEAQPPADSTPGGGEIIESLGALHEKIDKVGEKVDKVDKKVDTAIETGEDTNRRVTSLVGFVKTDLQTWLAEQRRWLADQRPRVDDDELIEQFAQKAAEHINKHIGASDREVGEEETHLQGIFGGTWNRLLPETQSSLISAGVLWKLCTDISAERFDYSGIVITATSALESELKRVFYTGFQQYMVEHYGDPTQQDANKTYQVWPEKLLSKTKKRYRQEAASGEAELPSLNDHFTLGTLLHLFSDKNAKQEEILVNRMGEYLRTVVREEYCGDPVKAFTDPDKSDNFVQQCENIREDYRNPAGHTAVLDRESAKECYTKVVGVGKMEAFHHTHEVEGLIMTLYGYLK